MMHQRRQRRRLQWPALHDQQLKLAEPASKCMSQYESTCASQHVCADDACWHLPGALIAHMQILPPLALCLLHACMATERHLIVASLFLLLIRSIAAADLPLRVRAILQTEARRGRSGWGAGGGARCGCCKPCSLCHSCCWPLSQSKSQPESAARANSVAGDLSPGVQHSRSMAPTHLFAGAAPKPLGVCTTLLICAATRTRLGARRK